MSISDPEQHPVCYALHNVNMPTDKRTTGKTCFCRNTLYNVSKLWKVGWKGLKGWKVLLKIGDENSLK
jgi:hypothetical protein